MRDEETCHHTSENENSPCPELSISSNRQERYFSEQGPSYKLQSLYAALVNKEHSASIKMLGTQPFGPDSAIPDPSKTFYPITGADQPLPDTGQWPQTPPSSTSVTPILCPTPPPQPLLLQERDLACAPPSITALGSPPRRSSGEMIARQPSSLSWLSETRATSAESRVSAAAAAATTPRAGEVVDNFLGSSSRVLADGGRHGTRRGGRRVRERSGEARSSLLARLSGAGQSLTTGAFCPEPSPSADFSLCKSVKHGWVHECS